MSWFSRKQKFVALSTAKAEYMAASLASCEALWPRKLLVNLFGFQLSKNPVFDDMSKHIEIRDHFIRDYVQRGAVMLQYISTDE